ncbi:MAG: c-type cytochrome [Acidobacteriota bacterium]
MRALLFVTIMASGLVAACGKGEEPPAPTTGSPNARPETGPRPKATASGNAKARALFDSLCATCHGADGRGDGPAAANLNPKPRDYTNAQWQASVTDDDLKRTILLGGMRTGKSPMMPGNPQLKDEPEVLDGLVKIIRSFKR